MTQAISHHNVIPTVVSRDSFNNSENLENESRPKGLPSGLKTAGMTVPYARDNIPRSAISLSLRDDPRSAILTPGQIVLFTAVASAAAIGTYVLTRNTSLGRFVFLGALALAGCGTMTTKMYVCPDEDGDGYSNEECDDVGGEVDSGVIGGGDCHDGDDSIYPGAEEYCDGEDNDCDGEEDEGIGDRYYEDSDGDDHGNADSSTMACEQPEGYVEDNEDCDDENNTVHSGAAEICDGLDNDCDEDIDEGMISSYQDADGDNYGNPDVATEECPPPSDYVSNDDDCDDTDEDVNPSENEIEGNGIDDNCNDREDELTVGCTSSDYDTIQDAVDAAIADVGEKTVYICSFDDAKTITIEPDDNLHIVGNPTVGFSAISPSVMNIDIPSGVAVMLSGLRFYNSDGEQGVQGIIQEGSGTLYVSSCEFNDLDAGNSAYGAAIQSGRYGTGDGRLSISYSSFEGNEHAYGGGAVYFEGNTLEIYNSTFLHNKANAGVSGGGAIYFAAGNAVIEDSDIGYNESDITGGGVLMLGGETLQSVNSGWYGNDPNDVGGDVSEFTGSGNFFCDSSLGTCEYE